jgi:hypothetical protein
LEQVKEMQKWAQIRKERRLAVGLPIEGMALQLPLMSSYYWYMLEEPVKVKEHGPAMNDLLCMFCTNCHC